MKQAPNDLNLNVTNGECYINALGKVCIVTEVEKELYLRYFETQTKVQFYPVKSNEFSTCYANKLGELKPLSSEAPLEKRCIRLPCLGKYYCIPLCSLF